MVESFNGRLPFATFYARTTPEILGAVTAISATTGIDQATGMTFFRVFVTVTPPELAKLGDLDLVPGMPIEGYIATGSRSAMDDLTRPIAERLAKAFRRKARRLVPWS